MNRMHWLTALGVSGAGLAALLLGQTVWGQPDAKAPLFPPPTIPAPEVIVPAKPDPKSPPSALPTIPELDIKPGPLDSGPPGPAPKQNTVPPKLDIAPPIIDLPTPGVDKKPIAPPLSRTVESNISYDAAPGRQQPAVTVEWSGPSTIRVNQPLACQLTVRNTSSIPAQNVTVRYRLTPGVTFKASAPEAVNEAGELVWNLGTLQADQSRRIDLTLTAQTRGVVQCAAAVTFTGVAAHHVQVREPQLAVKMTSPDKVVSGENVTLLFAVSNPGDGVAENVRLKTTLSDGLYHPRGRSIEFDVGNLAPKESKLLQLVCLAKGGGPQKGTITLNGDGGLTASDSSEVDILTPKLDIAMSGPKLRYLDRHAVYMLKVTNPGTAPATQVEVQKLVPPGFKFHQANQGGQYHESTRLVSWTIGELAPGQTKDVTVNLIPTEPGEHRLSAQAKASRGLKSEADAKTIVEGLPSLFIEVGHLDDPIEVGKETAFGIRLKNTGTKMETNVEVVCTLPEQLEFKGAKCSTTLRFRHEGRELIFEPLAKLAPKADVIYRVQVRGASPGDVRFRTRIKADGLRDPVLRDESIRVYSDELPARPTPGPAPIAPTPRKDATPIPTPIAPAPVPQKDVVPTPTPLPKNDVLPAPLPLPIPPASTPTIPGPMPMIPTPAPITPSSSTPTAPTIPTPLPESPRPTPGAPTPAAPLPAPPPLATLPSLPANP